MKHITTYKRNGRTFEIVKKDGYYMAIEDKDIDDAGKLTTELNGLEAFAHPHLHGCKELIDNKIDYDQYRKEGMTKVEAFAKIYGLSEEEAKVCF